MNVGIEKRGFAAMEYRYFRDYDETLQREPMDGSGSGEILWPDGTWAPWFIKRFDVVEITAEEARARFGALNGPRAQNARSLAEQLADA